jgi:hypothetical protein
VLYATGTDVPSVPEPSNWAMMLAGFAGLGVVMRMRGVKQVGLV